MKIRNMRLDDYDNVYALWLSCPGMRLNDWDDSREGIAKYLARNPNTCFVAEERGEIVGAILTGHDGRRGYISHTAVSPAHQRQGIGRQLFDALRDYAQAQGYSFLQVKTVQEGRYKEYDQTNAFYKGVGFKELECFPTLWDEWNPCQILVMAVSR